MKRIILLLLVVITNVTLSFAGGKVTLAKGDKKVFNENAQAVFEFDLSGTRFDSKKDFKEWCGSDYKERVDLMEASFIGNFNDKFNLKISKSASDAKYKVIFHVDNFERKLVVITGYCALMRVFGVIEIVDNQTNATVCTVRIDGVDGKKDYVETDRFPKAMTEVIAKLSKFIKK